MEKRLSPWAWVSTLYFLQGIPYVIVNNISVVMFTKMGVPMVRWHCLHLFCICHG